MLSTSNKYNKYTKKSRHPIKSMQQIKHDRKLNKSTRPLHSTNPRRFKDLSRMNRLPLDYDYDQVYTDLKKSKEIGLSLSLTYGLKYAVGFKRFELPETKIKNSLIRSLI